MIQTFLSDLPESRDLLDFYRRASIVYNITPFTLTNHLDLIVI